jgi:hypothetical protein
MMTMQEFERLARTWGGDIARWPSDRRLQAEALSASPEAQAALEEARRFDAQIAGAAPEIAAERVGQVMFGVVNAIGAGRRPIRTAMFPLRWLMPATGFACAAFIGVSLALTHPVDLMRRPADAGTIFSLLLDSTSHEPDWTIQ